MDSYMVARSTNVKISEPIVSRLFVDVMNNQFGGKVDVATEFNEEFGFSVKVPKILFHHKAMMEKVVPHAKGMQRHPDRKVAVSHRLFAKPPLGSYSPSEAFMGAKFSALSLGPIWARVFISTGGTRNSLYFGSRIVPDAFSALERLASAATRAVVSSLPLTIPNQELLLTPRALLRKLINYTSFLGHRLVLKNNSTLRVAQT